MLYSEIKEREHRFFLSLKITIPFVFFLLFIFSILTTKIDIKSLLENNIIAFLIIFFIYVYYILYQIYMVFETSMIDSITKAFSRKYMIKIINEKMKKEKFLIVGVKIKNITDINERYGIKKTDEVMNFLVKKIDEFLVSNGYKNVIIGHIIGGNFAFLMDCDEKKVNHLMKQFINRMKNSTEEEIYLNLIYSYICSDAEDNAEDILTLLFEQFDIDDINRRKNRRLRIKVDEFEKLVVDLIEKREFDFRFQPIQNVKSGKKEIYEVLIKLKSKKYGKISQKEFISVVNRIGYENIFDKILLEEILKISLSLDKKVKFSVNISSYSIKNSLFLNDIRKLVKEYKDAKNSIILDVSGSSYIDDVIKLNENIKLLKELGFEIAMDNFGSDSTTFSHIKNLNFDIVKFDIDYSKRYKQKVFSDIIKAFVFMFEDLGVKTVIKFVESEESYNFFKSVGIDYIQGYIVGKPVDLKKLRSEV